MVGVWFAVYSLIIFAFNLVQGADRVNSWRHWYLDDERSALELFHEQFESIPVVCRVCFTARRYASAAFAVVVRPPVCLSVRVFIITAGRIEPVFGTETFWPILYCVIRKSGCLQNAYTSPGNFVGNSGLRKFRHFFVNSIAMVQLVDDTYTTVDESRLFTTRRSTVTL